MPRFSFATTYAPPLVRYARTVCMYEATTTDISSAMATVIGRRAWRAASDVPTRTRSVASTV